MQINEFRVWCCSKRTWEPSKTALMSDGAVMILLGDIWCTISHEHIVEFYIGINDKNDRKLYEGDRVKRINMYEYVETATIRFNKGEFYPDRDKCKEGTLEFLESFSPFWNDCEYIGNIHKKEYVG